MSTPTPSSQAQSQAPNSASKLTHPTSYAAHAVSTPTGHLNLTSASAASSPAIPRSTAGKTPAASVGNTSGGTPHGHHYSSKSIGGAGGIAMAPSLSQMSNFSGTSASAGLGIGGLGVSPSAVENLRLLSGFASPAAGGGLGDLGMGTGIGTPGQLLDVAALGGGQAMNISLSELGLSSTAGRRNEDEERRIKLEGVLNTLAGRPKGRDGRGARSVGMGRVSDEGVRRVGRLAGFDVEVEAKWEGKEFEGQRPIIVAGRNAVLIDLNFKDNVPDKIDVSFASENPAVTAHQEAAAKVLLDDLTPAPGAAAINVKLDRFAANLESLSQLDKLSSSQLNCFEAITGVYTSLCKLYEHEKETAKALIEARGSVQEAMAVEEVVRKRTGRPRMHAGRRVGLGLEYWQEKRPLSILERQGQGLHNSTPAEDDVSSHVLEITAEATDPSMYTPLRVSSEWLSDRVIKPTEETTDPTDLMTGKPSIDWLDPEPTYLSSNSDEPDAMALDNDSNRKLPEARFVARLWPPVIMPWNIAGQILQNVGLTSMPTADQPGSYEAMLLPQTTMTVDSRGGPVFTATQQQIVVDKTGTETQAEHKYSLYVPKQDYAYRLTEIPFAHPRQIIQALPVLRQWASFGTLLTAAFPNTPSATLAKEVNKSTVNGHKVNNNKTNGTKPNGSTQIPLTDLLATSNKGDGDTELPIDITLSTSPTPSLTLLFPFTSPTAGATLAFVVVGVMTEGDIVILGQNVVHDDDDQSDVNMQKTDAGDMEGIEGQEQQKSHVQKEIERMVRALELCGELGTWVEWIRMRYGK